MLYVWAGYPKTGLNAGGLQHAIEQVEELGLLVHDNFIQYRKEGEFIVTDKGEECLCPLKYRMSDLCYRDGIEMAWFPDNWSFGNGATVHKVSANWETKVVIHGTDLTVQDLLNQGEVVDFSKLKLQQTHNLTEGWEKYEARWRPGTCPHKTHIVQLTWLVTPYTLPAFAEQRLEELIERPGATLKDQDRYEQKHFSVARPWDGRAAVGQGVPAMGRT